MKLNISALGHAAFFAAAGAEISRECSGNNYQIKLAGKMASSVGTVATDIWKMVRNTQVVDVAPMRPHIAESFLSYLGTVTLALGLERIGISEGFSIQTAGCLIFAATTWLERNSHNHGNALEQQPHNDNFAPGV